MSHRVLIVACREESRESSYLLSQGLESYGYSTENTHVDTDGKSKIKIDRIMESGLSLSDFLGVVFFDDGGDEEIAIEIAKKALKADKVIGGFSVSGCKILLAAGALKDAFVCAGLPEEFYENAKDVVDSPAVRSSKIITGVGDCTSGFGIVLVDALGGKVKRVIKSKDAEETVKTLVDPERGKVVMTHSNSGWKITASALPTHADRARAHEAALHAVVIAQAECESPDNIGEAAVSLVFNDDGPVVEKVDTDEEDRRMRTRRLVCLERELAREGLFVQPDGSIYIRGNPKGVVLTIDAAIEEIRRLALESLDNEIEEGDKVDSWTSICSRRHRHVIRCLLAFLELTGHKHSYRFAYLGAASIGGPNFGVAVSDMDWRARVWPIKEDEEWLKDREKFIEDLPRYNPEYLSRQNGNPNQYGVYYVWSELRRGPTSWKGSIKEMKVNSPYPINDALKP
jgi:hypothetical protein